MTLAAALFLSSCGDSPPGSSGGASTSVAPSTTSAPTPSTVPPAPVGLFGDSLAWEAEPFYERLLAEAGTPPVRVATFGGTAICDMLDDMAALAEVIELAAVHIAFSGNALTPCMDGYEPGTPEYFRKYRDDALAAIAIFAPAGTRVHLVAPPVMTNPGSGDGRVQDLLGEVYKGIVLADRRRVSFVDAGAAVENPDGSFARTLPCLSTEPCVGPVRAGVGTNVVRSADGVHFCPARTGNEQGLVERCPVHSSGAYRYALAMVTSLGGNPR